MANVNISNIRPLYNRGRYIPPPPKHCSYCTFSVYIKNIYISELKNNYVFLLRYCFLCAFVVIFRPRGKENIVLGLQGLHQSTWLHS